VDTVVPAKLLCGFRAASAKIGPLSLYLFVGWLPLAIRQEVLERHSIYADEELLDSLAQVFGLLLL
jgi:hypothetical protein